jgi:ketosteroid isomerase-like protein
MTESTGTTELSAEQEQVWAVLTDLYRAYIDGDRPRLEAHLADGCTLFDSSDPELMTKGSLQAARRDPEAAAASPRPIALQPSRPTVRIWDGFAVETHVLDAIFEDPSLNQHLRCSSMLRRDGDRWLIEHHHEELLTTGG